MFSKKPIIAIYKIKSEDLEKDSYLNAIISNDGKYHSFRCPSKKCGRPVKIGYKKCPFCGTHLKWEFPFESMEI